MPSAQDSLYEVFLEIAGAQKSNVTPVEIAGNELASTLKDVARDLTAVVAPKTALPFPQAIASGGGVKDVLETVGSSVLNNVFGAAPLIKGIISLFGGGGGSETPDTPLVKYALPTALHFNAADTGTGFRQVDFDQQGLPRAYRQDAAPAATERRETNPQVTVNVQAMDARSFLDRSTDIAAAVRDAMLHLNSLNDVVSDL